MGRETLFDTAMQVIDEALFRRMVELDHFAVLLAIVEQNGMPVVIPATP